MQNSRIIKLLKLLNPGEIKRFVAFVESPYFNRNERLVRLIKYLAQGHPTFSDHFLTRDVLLKTLFLGESAVSTQQLHDHFSMLVKLLEQFFSMEQYQEDSFGQEQSLLKRLAKKGETAHLNRVFKRVRKWQEVHQAQDTQYFLDSYLLMSGEDIWGGKMSRRNFEEQLQEASHYLDVFYLSARLKYSCELLNRKIVLKRESTQELSEGLRKFLATPPEALISYPVVKLYHCIFLMLSEEGHEPFFNRLLTLLKQYRSVFSPEEAYSMYAFATNYCVRQINQGSSKYLETLFELYKELLVTNLLERNGYIPHEYLKNIVTIGLRLKEFDWVKDFLEKYRNRMHPDIRQNAYDYNLAAYYYEQQLYRDALKLLQKVDFTDVYYHLGAKCIQLKVYFELEDDDGLLYLIKAVRMFLKRNKTVSAYQLRIHENLLKFAKKAVYLRAKKPILSVEEFQTKID
ncbi:MAG: hypothetical protein AAGI38_03310 [Bacteroidota bacterium]